VGWADGIRRLGVRANADTPEDAARARAFGAEGIGLCRTEHMFMSEERLPAVRAMILADDEDDRVRALERILPMQQTDFEGILEAMTGLPVTIRLLDPPLHEFLPSLIETTLEVERLRAAGETRPLRDAERLLARVKALHEQNPMLGTRGCRLGLLHPEIYAMQTRAVVRAALAVRARGLDPRVEIMIPLVGFAEELRRMRELVEEVMEEELERAEVSSLPVLVGTMIELPRAALMAGEIAEEASFFSFGTNDLTQTTLGVSRDDAGRFLGQYVEKGIYARDPFVSLDIEGVGQLVTMAAERGRATRSDIKLGICGEHGGDPASIAFCEQVGLDYVSASPYRVPIARLAAAQAALKA
jgi:pyruvate,orthophosphate dikinase